MTKPGRGCRHEPPERGPGAGRASPQKRRPRRADSHYRVSQAGDRVTGRPIVTGWRGSCPRPGRVRGSQVRGTGSPPRVPGEQQACAEGPALGSWVPGQQTGPSGLTSRGPPSRPSFLREAPPAAPATSWLPIPPSTSPAGSADLCPRSGLCPPRPLVCECGLTWHCHPCPPVHPAVQ